MTDRIAYNVQPGDWTVSNAAAQLDYFRGLVTYRQARTRPHQMHDIVCEAQVATLEVLERMGSGSKAKRRKGELSHIAGDLAVRWNRYAVLPVLIRSDEHKIALVQAAWAIKILRDVLEQWSV